MIFFNLIWFLIGLVGIIYGIIFTPGKLGIKVLFCLLILLLFFAAQYYIITIASTKILYFTRNRNLKKRRLGYGIFRESDFLNIMNASVQLYLANKRISPKLNDLVSWFASDSFLEEIHNTMKDELSRQIKPEFYKDRISNNFQSFFNFYLWNSCHKIWFMPPLCLDDPVEVDDKYKEFQILGLKDWKRFTIDTNYGKIYSTKYLFITWDLSKLDKWSDEEIEALKDFLNILKDRTKNDQLFIHRILILPNNVDSNETLREKFISKFYKPFFSSVNTNKYKILWIKEDAVSNAQVEAVTKTLFRDIALFCNKEYTQAIAGDSNAYDLIQFSINYPLTGRSDKNFLLLFALDYDEENADLFTSIIDKMRDFYGILDSSSCFNELTIFDE